MALANFSFPYQLAASSAYAYPGQSSQSAIDNLRLNAVLPPTPAPAFNDEQRYENEPYIPPAHYQHQQHQLQVQRHQQRSQESFGGHQNRAGSATLSSINQDTRYANYNQDFRRTQPRQQQIPQQQVPQQHVSQQQVPQQQISQQQAIQQQQQQIRPPPTNQQQQQPRIQQPRVPVSQEHVQQSPQQSSDHNHDSRNSAPDNYPSTLDDGYTRVNGGAYGSADAKTSVHAILDYDDDEDDGVEDYYDEDDANMPKDPRVTPIQGPIYLKNGSVPVVPLYSYPQLNNGSFIQIPILWTALSVALGVELRGDLVKGTPCIKRHHQLYCPTAGKAYPTERIEEFIDENKALMKRMYGVFEMNEDHGPPNHSTGKRRRRNVKNYDLPDGGPSLRAKSKNKSRGVEGGESFFNKVRKTRQANANGDSKTGRIDACESESEIITPYWAKNSAGKKRAVVNTQHFEQAIRQELCTKTQTDRCRGDCGCEQKFKWHRLLAYDPDNECKGIFMDWFIFPSCCVCRCDPINAAVRMFQSTTTRN